MQIEAFSEAKIYFEKVMVLAPKQPEAWLKRGLIGMILAEEPASFELYFDQARMLDESYYQVQMKRLDEIQTFIQKNK